MSICSNVISNCETTQISLLKSKVIILNIHNNQREYNLAPNQQLKYRIRNSDSFWIPLFYRGNLTPGRTKSSLFTSPFLDAKFLKSRLLRSRKGLKLMNRNPVNLLEAQVSLKKQSKVIKCKNCSYACKFRILTRPLLRCNTQTIRE